MEENEIKNKEYLEKLISSEERSDISNLSFHQYKSSDSIVPFTLEEIVKYEVEKQLSPIRQTQNAIIMQTAEIKLEIDSIKNEVKNATDIYIENYQLKKKIKNLNSLSTFESFELNWNGYNAKPFTEKLIKKVRDIINSPLLKFQPNIFPTGRQSIQFEYEKANGNYLEIEIFEGNITSFSIISDKETYNDSLTEETMFRMINDFHSGF